MTITLIQLYIAMILFTVGLIAAVAYLRYSWKNKTSELESKTTDTWKDYADVLEKKFSNLEMEFKQKMAEKDKEIKDLTAQVNRLKGERDALLNVKPDGEFKNSIQSLLNIYDRMENSLTSHYTEDVKQFDKLFKAVRELQDKMQILCDKI